MPVEHNAFPRALSLAVHEFRTPVTVVSGYLRMLLKEQGGPLTEKQRKMLEEAERSCGRIGALVAEMSELGKLEGGELAGARQAFDLAPLVAGLGAGMQGGDDPVVRRVARRPRACPARRATRHRSARRRALVSRRRPVPDWIGATTAVGGRNVITRA